MFSYCVLILLILIFLIYKPNGFNNKRIATRPSKIQGVGLFTEEYIYPNERIFDGINNHFITKPGSLINHSWNPNTTTKRESFGKYGIYATKLINPNEEITINYNDENLPFYISHAKSHWK